MQTIELANKKTFQATDYSSIESVVISFASLAEVEEARKQFIEENMKRVMFGEEEYLNVQPIQVNVVIKDENITATFTNKKATEIELLKQQLAEIQEALAESVGR